MSEGPPVGATEERRRRPPRPALVELASAILIVNGAVSTITSLEVIGQATGEAGPSTPFLLLSLALGVGGVVLGLLVRYGQGWLITVNVAAIAGFLELTSGVYLGLLFGALDVIVVLALFRERPWVTWSPDAAAREERDRAD